MNIIKVPVALLRLQYRIARFPFQVVADTVMTRLDSETPARLFYERSLGTVDAVVGGALGDANLQTSGAALVERSDALSRAARLDAAAETKREKADAQLRSTRAETTSEFQEARETRQKEEQAARESAQQRTRNAAESAQKRTAAAKRDADVAANKQAEAVEKVRKNEREAIRAEEQAAADEARSKMEEAAAKRGEATSRRMRAEKLDDLADNEKEKRQSDRAGTDA